MIRIRKSPAAPQELTSSGYSSDAVRKRILADQDGKCYLCERDMRTDFQVEHRQSQANNPDKTNDWTNLLMSCGYCNGKKLNGFDDVVDPTSVNVEELIYQHYDPARETFEFSPRISVTPEITKTCGLLDRIFNGTKPKLLTIRELAFRKEFLAFYNRFSKKLCDYLQTPTTETESLVKEELNVLRTYLGFKYWMIMDVPVLKQTFEPLMRWNRI